MTIDEIRELIQVVNETGIAKLVVQRGEHSVEIVRTVAPLQDRITPVAGVVPVAVSTVAAPPVALASPAPAEPPLPAAAAASDTLASISDKDVIVKSPIVGTYYDAASPDAPKFVKIGDRVEPKQVLCIIESMKLMNEIEAEIAGTVVSKFVDNGRPVEYGESLFAIRPS